MAVRTTRRRFVALAILVSVSISGSAHAATDGRRARYATRFLATHQNEDGSFVGGFSPIGTAADSVVALVAARRGRTTITRALSFLRSHVATATLGQKAKMVAAVVAAGRDPRAFGGHNLVAELRSSLAADGQYTDPSVTNAEVTDQALTIIALRGARAHVPRRAMKWLAAAQCDDGGWQFDDPAAPAEDEHCYDQAAPPPGDFIGSDSNTTAYAVMAWNARPSTIPLPADPFDFFQSARDSIKGGWVYDGTGKCSSVPSVGFCYLTDANSTALVVQAHLAEGVAVPAGGVQALRALQEPLCGPRGGGVHFTWDYSSPDAYSGPTDVGATAGAIPALVRKPLPLTPHRVTEPVPARKTC